MRDHAINVVELAETAAEIWRFFIFQNGGRRHLAFFKFQFLTVGTYKQVELRHCQISSKSLVRKAADGDFSIFSTWPPYVRHLGFVMRLLGPPTKHIWWSLSLCRIWLESTH